MSQNYTWPAVQVAPAVGGATAANQILEIAQLTAINASTASIDTKTITVDTDNVTVVASALPTGAATSANQTTANASLSSIDSKLTSPLAVTGPLTDAELRAAAVPVSTASLPLPTGAATSANQTSGSQKTQITDSSGNAATVVLLSNVPALTDRGITAQAVIHGLSSAGGGGFVDVKVTPSGKLLSTIDIDQSTPGTTNGVVVNSSALPTGAATSANQTTANASLSSIDSKLTSPLAVTGPLTDTQLRATAVPVSAASLPLPTGAATEATLSAFSTKSQAGLVPEAFDEQVITYVGATDRINTVVYKLATVTVATLTMSYDGSDRLSGVVKT